MYYMAWTSHNDLYLLAEHKTSLFMYHFQYLYLPPRMKASGLQQ